MPTCPNCGNQAADNAVFCDQCGTRMPAIAPEAEPVVQAAAGSVPEGVLVCPDCGAENVPGELFCDVCGNPLEAPEPVPEPVAEALIEAEPMIEPVAEQVLEAEPIVQVEPAAGAESYCPTCGAEIQPSDTFCGNCGASLDRTAFEDEIAPVEPILDETVEPELQAEPIEVEPAIPDEVLVDQVLIEQVIVEEEPFEQVVVEETVVEETPVDETPVDETSVAEAVVALEEPQCPVCGANVLPGQTFCASCGAALEPVEATPEPEIIPEPVVAPAAESAAGSYVELVDSGAYIPLVDQPELLVGRVDEISGVYPDVDMTPHGGEEAGVSRRHARLIHEGNAWFVVDLNSTNGTFVNGTELQPKTRAPLNDGDRLTLGELEAIVHIQ